MDSSMFSPIPMPLAVLGRSDMFAGLGDLNNYDLGAPEPFNFGTPFAGQSPNSDSDNCTVPSSPVTTRENMGNEVDNSCGNFDWTVGRARSLSSEFFDAMGAPLQQPYLGDNNYMPYDSLLADPSPKVGQGKRKSATDSSSATAKRQKVKGGKTSKKSSSKSKKISSPKTKKLRVKKSKSKKSKAKKSKVPEIVVDPNVPRIGAYTLEERKAKILAWRQKAKRRIWNKKIKYGCRKRLADARPRVKGRFVKSLPSEGKLSIKALDAGLRPARPLAPTVSQSPNNTPKVNSSADKSTASATVPKAI